MQSGFRKYHSTETLLIKVFNDIGTTLDAGRNALLTLLDLSSAFDTLDHEILFERLHSRFGHTGKVLSWIKSYFSQRSEVVSINGILSNPQPVKSGVPQGSILGPLLFNLYISPIEDLAQAHAISILFYADDAQIYLSLSPSNTAEPILLLESCLSDLNVWFSENKLVCNPSKTNIIYFSPRSRISPVNFSIKFGPSVLHPVDNVLNLGVIWDKHMSLKPHINKICKTASLSLYRLGALRAYLDIFTLERLVHAFISCRLDYCNALFVGLPARELHRLQSIQNTAARLIHGSKKYDHITPILKSLHWLPVKARIDYKILLTTYKILNGFCPTYLTNQIHLSESRYHLRSTSSGLLRQPSYRTKNYGSRIFSFSSPHLWNSIPTTIRNAGSVEIFKKHIKTHLFNLYYS